MKLIKKTNVAALPFTGKEPCIYWGDRGFGCRVYKSGKRAWVLTYRKSGKKRLFTIGDFPGISRETAEDISAAYRLQINAGGDPALEKRLAANATGELPKPALVGNC